MAGRFDDMFFMIAQELGSIDKILFEFFGFLKRRTDFFVLANPGDPAGFPPGVAERMVYSIYKKYRDEHDKEHPFTPRAEPVKKESPKEPPKDIGESKKESTEQKEESKEKVKEEKKPEPRIIDPSVTEISTYNGAKTEKYNWSQDLNDTTIQIKLPAGTKSKDIDVKIQKDFICVKLKRDPTNPLIEGKLFESINRENSLWQLDSGTLVITLEKAKDSVWKTVLVGDEEIDPKQVDTSRRVDEYDEETQMGIRKVMHEHDRKLKGLPSTDEEAAMDKMKEMWKNSKLGNEPFDMSRIGEILTYKPNEEEKKEDED